MKIRAIVAADMQALWEINQSMVPAVGSVDLERMALLVATSEQALLVEDALPNASSATAEIVGFALVFAPGSTYDSLNYLWFAENYPSAHYLDRVAFRESAQGQGMGKALYRHIGGVLRERGVREMGLEINVDPPNPQSLAFHKGLGFDEVGQLQTPYGTRVSLQLKNY